MKPGEDAQKSKPINIQSSVGFEDFQMIKVLGRGTFGKVFLVRHRETKKIYAMKTIRKDVIFKAPDAKDSLVEKSHIESEAKIG